MEVFTQIDGAQAIVRYPKGVHKQVQLYHRRDRVYIPHSGGFVEVRDQEVNAETLTTAHPDVKVIEYDRVTGMGIVTNGGLKSMRWATR
jgi:hypothetical protein